MDTLASSSSSSSSSSSRTPDTSANTGYPIIKLANNKAILSMVLALNPTSVKKNPRGYEEKLFLHLTNYDPQGKSANTYLRHAIDGPAFRMIGQVILDNLFLQAVQSAEFGPEATTVVAIPNSSYHYYQYKEFKGSPDKSTGQYLSRILTLSWNDTPGHKAPWAIKLTEGPGKPTATGLVKPIGAPTHMVQMTLSRSQMRQWMLLGIEALQSLTTVQLLRSPLL